MTHEGRSRADLGAIGAALMSVALSNPDRSGESVARASFRLSQFWIVVVVRERL
jgi:hypothetical protein